MKIIITLILTFFAATQGAIFWPKVHHRELLRPPFIRKFFLSDEIPSTPAADHEYTVALMAEGTGFCSGSLISDQKVLTSAQCVVGASTMFVHLGALNLYDETEPQRLIVESSDYKIHENFDIKSPLEFDIAIITLPEPVSGEGFFSVRLPTHSDNRTFDNYLVHASGWGRTDASKVVDLRSIRNELARSSMSVYSNQECRGLMGPIITSNHICGQPAGVSSCYGDPGSPLAVPENDGIYTQIGIASFGSWAGCETGSPQVFTRITEFLTWIEDQGVTINP